MTTRINQSLFFSVLFAFLAMVSMNTKASAQFTYYNYQYADFTRYLIPDPKTYDYFDAGDTQQNTVNSYLLSQLADKIYMDAPTLSSFRQQLEEEFGPQGLEVEHVFMNWWTGTDGAVLSNEDAVFVVFRGTSSQGTPSPWSDYLGDIDDDFKQVTVAQKTFWVHKGFWHNVDSVINGIILAVTPHYSEGKKVWICGHSLGGANATLAGMRLHYQYGIDVQGIETFGAPKVGDIGLKSKFQDANNHGIRLDQRTKRWVMHNDPAHTFFEKALIPYKTTFLKWNYYEHVGIINKIYPQYDGNFHFYLNSSSSTMVYNSLYGGLMNEHTWYDEALRYKLYKEGYGYVAE